jgi:hypothetical protein
MPLCPRRLSGLVVSPLYLGERGVGLNGIDAVEGRLAGGVALRVAERLAIGRPEAEIPLVVHAFEDRELAPRRHHQASKTGHRSAPPTHKKVFRLFQDCEQTLAPEIADKFEREANNFARFVLFQGDAFRNHAADLQLGVKVPMRLASHFGSSVYAAAREYARTHHASCVVYILNPIQLVPNGGFVAQVRRIEPSPRFRREFGCPADSAIDQDHALASLIPIGRRMTAPRDFVFADLNGVRHSCIGEAFDTRHNILLLIYPQSALPTSILVPAPTHSAF